MSDRLLGGIEAGGTKFVCVVGTGPDDIRERARIDTTTPDETIGASIEFFGEIGPVSSIGIATFGPVELRRGSNTYGFITTTPKSGWEDADLAGRVERELGVPVAIETDVTGAALGEWRWGAGRGYRTIVYVTVGTGIGGGLLIDGRATPGLVHPEMGHVLVERQPGDEFPGNCPYHGDCLEGMAAGPAIEERWGRRGEELRELEEQAIELEAKYLASGFRNIVYAVAPERIILGGGVGSMPGLVERVQAELLATMNGYAVLPEHQADFVVAPGLGVNSGAAGALALAEQALT
jgi:fructokinase